MRALLSRRHPSTLVESVLTEMAALGALDDRRTGLEWLRYRREMRPLGRLRLEAELRRRAIGEEMVADLLAEYYREGSEADDLERALERLLRAEGIPSEPRSAGRLAARLGRRGFAAGDVQAEMERVLAGRSGKGWMHERQ